MDLIAPAAPWKDRRLPRTRGDGPELNRLDDEIEEASPHSRGWTFSPSAPPCYAALVHDITLWRWVFGLALVPTAGWVWLWRDAYPDSGLLDLALSLIPAYLLSLLFAALMAWLVLAIFNRALDAWDFLRELLGFRPAP